VAQAAAERAVELVVSALDVNALLDQVDLNAVLDQVDIDRLLDRIDLDRLLARVDFNDIVQHIDFDALIEETDLGTVIAACSSGAASDALDVVRSQTVAGDSELNPAALPPTVVPMWSKGPPRGFTQTATPICASRH
jgi:hypothetical protein